MSNQASHILITVDVEDWFQVENFKESISYSAWPSCELRVERNTRRLLDLFDSIKFDSERNAHAKSPAGNGKLKATFFILGWLAERLPQLIREIYARGHEVASHGYNHRLCHQESSDSLKFDLIRSKGLLEDMIGSAVYGYRAPSFSISNDILKTIQDCGYRYDSSFNSFGRHGRYGHVAFHENRRRGIAYRVSDSFFELPVSNLKLFDTVLPWGGGGYFRLVPLIFFSWGVHSILKREPAYLFYMHPWEIDHRQPAVKNVPKFYRFRHYFNLKKTEQKLIKFLNHYRHYRFVTCSEYLENLKTNPAQ